MRRSHLATAALPALTIHGTIETRRMCGAGCGGIGIPKQAYGLWVTGMNVGIGWDALWDVQGKRMVAG